MALFLVDAKHGCVLRRIEIQTGDSTARRIARLDKTLSTICPAYDECLRLDLPTLS
jgi:hypothetical protein